MRRILSTLIAACFYAAIFAAIAFACGGSLLAVGG